jgi:hypothetical protein
VGEQAFWSRAEPKLAIRRLDILQRFNKEKRTRKKAISEDCLLRLCKTNKLRYSSLESARTAVWFLHALGGSIVNISGKLRIENSQANSYVKTASA